VVVGALVGGDQDRHVVGASLHLKKSAYMVRTENGCSYNDV
jgi:hypothetical protein